MLSDLIAPFISLVEKGDIEIYNEFSLQHELGIFLRHSFSTDRVRFERNVKSLFPALAFQKREIDICITSPESNELKWAIELKYPRNGQYPEQMFSFCRDISFVEELKSAGFKNAGLIIFAEDRLFWEGPSQGIYQFFRAAKPLQGQIIKPTGSKDDKVFIRGSYSIKWESICRSSKRRFAVIEV